MSADKMIYDGILLLGIKEEAARRYLYERITGKRRLCEMTPEEKEAVVSELWGDPYGRQYWENYEGSLRRRIAQHLWAAAGYRKGGPKSRWVRRQIREELERCRELRIALKQWRLPG